MTRRIRSPRAARLQGTRAGALSRLLVWVIDVLLAWGAYVIGVAGAGIVWDFLHRGPVKIPNPGPAPTVLATWLILVLLLTFGWSTTGRSPGKQVLGLRVVGRDARILRARTAFVRAVLYTVFPIGALWVLVDRANASVQDRLLRTVVVYDWLARDPLPPSMVAAPDGPSRV